VYGLQKLSVVISPVTTGGGGLIQNNTVKLWYHIDRLGSVDYMSDNVMGKVASYIDYDEWGVPLKKNVLKLGLRELDMAIDYTGHAYDQVLGLYYAKARMYDAADRRFMAVDPEKGNSNNPQTLVQYTYTLGNPILYSDPTGEMPVKILNYIKDAYLANIIPIDYVGSVVIIANICSLSTDFVSKIASFATLNVRELVKIVIEIEEELKSDSPSKQAIYLSFHETAQVLAAKQIYETYPALASILQPWPELEKIASLLPLRELDIAFGNYMWEVKPGYTSNSAFVNSLKKYVKDYAESKDVSLYKAGGGWKIPGGTFPSITAKLFQLANSQVNMTVEWLGPGKIGYFFQMKCGQNGWEDAKAVDILPELLPAFQKAEQVNTMTELVTCFAAFIAACISPVPGDEVAAGAALTKLITQAGLI
jgi:RHS repeat-associated protein